MALYRIQSSPDAEAGGIPPDDVVTVSRTELEALRARAAGSPSVPPTATDPAADDRADFERAARDRDTAHAEELAARERKVAELERSYRAALRDRELATSLAGKPLVAGAAAQLIKLWRDDFDAYEESGEFRVCARDGRAIQQTIAERLADPEYAHFCLPSSRGGSGGQDTNRAAKSQPAVPKNLGEAVVSQWREQAAARAGGGPKPIGLGRRR